MKNVKVLTTLDEIKSFSDPYRIIIMKHFFRLKRPATVKQIADEMGDVPAKVHYHVKKLVASGLLKLNHTKEINGILAKYYEPTAKMFHIENQEIGKFRFNDQLIDFDQTADDEDLTVSEDNTAICISEHALLLTNEELSQVMAYLNTLREQNVKASAANNAKKYLVSVTSAE